MEVNATDGSKPTSPTDGYTDAQTIILTTLFLLTALLMLAGYLWVIVTVARTRSLHTVSNFFLASLAVAEIVVAVCGLPCMFTLTIGQIFSFASVFLMSFGVFLSVIGYFLNGVLIAADKWFKISRPFVYVRVMTRSRCTVCLTTVWGLTTVGSLSGAVAHSVNLRVDDSEEVFTTFSLMAVIYCYFIILPCVFVITLFNILIVRIARHQVRAIAADLPAAPRTVEGALDDEQGPSPGKEVGMFAASNRKSTKQFSIFFFSFVLAWIPVVVVMPIVHITAAASNTVVVVILLIGSMFVLSQAAFGTLILTLLQQEYKQILKGDLRAMREKLHCVRRR